MKLCVGVGEVGKEMGKVVRERKGYNGSGFFIFWVRYKWGVGGLVVMLVSKKRWWERMEWGYDLIVMRWGKNKVR